jgi:hypothetical protein
MKKTKIMSISEFLNGKDPESFEAKLKRHLDKYGIVYRIVGATAVIYFTGGFDFVFAAGGGYTDGIIDREARIIYKDLTDIGRWLIVGRGGWEVITCAIKHDMEGAKKSFMGYLVAYVLLMSFPHLMGKIDTIFDRFGA